MKAITTKYYGPGNVRGSRIRAFDMDGNSVTVPWDYVLNNYANHKMAAHRLCRKMGWDGADTLVSGSIKGGMVHVFPEK